ncbi:Uncharacterised protein [uncultured archaeon]|nr:Uncharacterised protein [uncultured archaeon]
MGSDEKLDIDSHVQDDLHLYGDKKFNISQLIEVKKNLTLTRNVSVVAENLISAGSIFVGENSKLIAPNLKHVDGEISNYGILHAPMLKISSHDEGSGRIKLINLIVKNGIVMKTIVVRKK